MDNSRFFLKYFLPFLTLFYVPLSMFNPFHVLIVILIIIPILLFPRLYRYIDKRFNLKVGTSSRITDYINRIDFLKEDGKLCGFYSVLYGGWSYNSNRLWIFKLSTIYTMLFFFIGIIYLQIKPAVAESLVLQLIPILILLTPFILFSIHLTEIGHRFVPLYAIIYSLVIPILTISSFLMMVVLFVHFIYKTIKNVLMRLRLVVRV